MKHRHSYTDQESTDDDEKLHKLSYQKVARQSPTQSKHKDEEKPDCYTQSDSLDKCVVRQDLLYSLDGIFVSPEKFQNSTPFEL